MEHTQRQLHAGETHATRKAQYETGLRGQRKGIETFIVVKTVLHLQKAKRIQCAAKGEPMGEKNLVGCARDELVGGKKGINHEGRTLREISPNNLGLYARERQIKYPLRSSS